MEKTTKRATILSCLKECRKVLHELMGPEVNNEIIDFDELATNKDVKLSEDDIATINAIKAVEKELKKKTTAKKSLREQLKKHEISGGSQKQPNMLAKEEMEFHSLCLSPTRGKEIGHSIPVRDYERE